MLDFYEKDITSYNKPILCYYIFRIHIYEKINSKAHTIYYLLPVEKKIILNMDAIKKFLST